jgi:purine-binding chemotaxis protein CheW
MRQTEECADTVEEKTEEPIEADVASEHQAEGEKPNMEEESINLMGFKLSNEEYAVDIMQLKEITPVFELTAIPRAPEYILGILSLRGSIIPIFDLKKRIGLPETAVTEKSRIIVIKTQEDEVGILVDSITSAANIPLRSIEPPPPVIKGVQAEYISGVGRVDDRTIIIMNIEEITLIEEFGRT